MDIILLEMPNCNSPGDATPSFTRKMDHNPEILRFHYYSKSVP